MIPVMIVLSQTTFRSYMPNVVTILVNVMKTVSCDATWHFRDLKHPSMILRFGRAKLQQTELKALIKHSASFFC